MNEQYTPTTEEVLGMLGAYLYEYGAECDMNLPGNSPDEIVERWLAEVERAAAEKAWDELAGYVATKDGGQSEGEFLKEQNPYRKAGKKKEKS